MCADKPAETEDPRGLRMTAAPTKPAARGTGWAVIVGINEYTDEEGIGRLKYCEKDAQAFYQILTTSCGFPRRNCRLLLGSSRDARSRPTRSNLYATLTSWLSLAKKPDIVIVYFAGHGIESNRKSYLLPQDARVTNPALTGLPLSHVKDFLRKSRADRKVLIVDACHSGEGRDLGTMRLNWTDNSKGLVCITSCDIGQKSYEFKEKAHGVFTWFLKQGILGAADSDGDGYVRISEVNRYVTDQVRRWAAERGLSQSPRFVASVSGDPILARYEPTMPVPKLVVRKPAPETTHEGLIAVSGRKDPNRFDLLLLKTGKVVECEATVIGDHVYFKRYGISASFPMTQVQAIRYGAGGDKAAARRSREKRRSQPYVWKASDLRVELWPPEFEQKGDVRSKVILRFRFTNTRKDRADMANLHPGTLFVAPNRGKTQDRSYWCERFDLPYGVPHTCEFVTDPFYPKPSTLSIHFRPYDYQDDYHEGKRQWRVKFLKIAALDPRPTGATTGAAGKGTSSPSRTSSSSRKTAGKPLAWKGEDLMVEVISAKFHRKGKHARRIAIRFRMTNTHKYHADMGMTWISETRITPDVGESQVRTYFSDSWNFELPYGVPHTGEYMTGIFEDRPSFFSLFLKLRSLEGKKYTAKFPKIRVTDAKEK